VLQVQIEHVKKKTKADRRGGKNPRWNQRLLLEIIPGRVSINVKVYDEDMRDTSLIGGTDIRLDRVFGQGVHEEWFPLFHPYKNKFAGDVHLRLGFRSIEESQPNQNTADYAQYEMYVDNKDLSRPSLVQESPMMAQRPPVQETINPHQQMVLQVPANVANMPGNTQMPPQRPRNSIYPPLAMRQEAIYPEGYQATRDIRPMQNPHLNPQRGFIPNVGMPPHGPPPGFNTNNMYRQRPETNMPFMPPPRPAEVRQLPWENPVERNEHPFQAARARKALPTNPSAPYFLESPLDQDHWHNAHYAGPKFSPHEDGRNLNESMRPRRRSPEPSADFDSTQRAMKLGRSKSQRARQAAIDLARQRPKGSQPSAEEVKLNELLVELEEVRAAERQETATKENARREAAARRATQAYGQIPVPQTGGQASPSAVLNPTDLVTARASPPEASNSVNRNKPTAEESPNMSQNSKRRSTEHSSFSPKLLKSPNTLEGSQRSENQTLNSLGRPVVKIDPPSRASDSTVDPHRLRSVSRTPSPHSAYSSTVDYVGGRPPRSASSIDADHESGSSTASYTDREPMRPIALSPLAPREVPPVPFEVSEHHLSPGNSTMPLQDNAPSPLRHGRRKELPTQPHQQQQAKGAMVAARSSHESGVHQAMQPPPRANGSHQEPILSSDTGARTNRRSESYGKKLPIPVVPPRGNRENSGPPRSTEDLDPSRLESLSPGAVSPMAPSRRQTKRSESNPIDSIIAKFEDTEYEDDYSLAYTHVIEAPLNKALHHSMDDLALHSDGAKMEDDPGPMHSSNDHGMERQRPIPPRRKTLFQSPT